MALTLGVGVLPAAAPAKAHDTQAEEVGHTVKGRRSERQSRRPLLVEA